MTLSSPSLSFPPPGSELPVPTDAYWVSVVTGSVQFEAPGATHTIDVSTGFKGFDFRHWFVRKHGLGLGGCTFLELLKLKMEIKSRPK